MITYRRLDISRLNRRAHFDYFRGLRYPYVGVTAPVRAEALVDACREGKLSFYLTFMHAVALAANRVPELRRRIDAGGIIEFDSCPTSHTELKADGTYAYCTLDHSGAFGDYYRRALKAREACLESGDIQEDPASAETKSLLFISTLPWVGYTALIQPVDGGEDANPRITWGRYEVSGSGKTGMPVTLLAHHALVDGVHIGRFYEGLEALLTDVPAFFSDAL